MIRIKKTYIILIILIGLFLDSCGGFGFLYQTLLTDRIYIIAVDEMAQMNICYKDDENSYSGLIDETVFAVGYNDDFIIAKQHPRKFPNQIQKDLTNYYIINLKAINEERAAFKSKIDTIRYSSVLKDIHGNDSLGAENIQISESCYTPNSPIKLTYNEFILLRQELKVPDILDFTIIFEELK